MKNLLTIVFVGLLAITFSACGGEKVAEKPAMTKAITADKNKINDLRNMKKPAGNNQLVAGTGVMPWVKLDKVETLVKKEKKKILVDVYTPWCGPCKMMDKICLLYTSPSPRDQRGSRMPSSA